MLGFHRGLVLILFCILWLVNNVLKHIVIYSVKFSCSFVCSSLKQNLMECLKKKWHYLQKINWACACDVVITFNFQFQCSIPCLCTCDVGFCLMYHFHSSVFLFTKRQQIVLFFFQPSEIYSFITQSVFSLNTCILLMYGTS